MLYEDTECLGIGTLITTKCALSSHTVASRIHNATQIVLVYFRLANPRTDQCFVEKVKDIKNTAYLKLIVVSIFTKNKRL